MQESIFHLAMPGLFNALTPFHLFMISVAMVIGIIAGALPGISGTTACALLVPFTFAMQPDTGLVLLGAIWTGANYGGSNSAILLNIPGTPANIATTFDGYPMTKNGQGEQALLCGLICSVIGGIVGTLVLIFVFAPLAVLSVKFGKAEFFLLCVFGLTTIASMSAGNTLKGLLGACIGLMLGTIGLDPVIGIPRFTFGVDSLIGGIQLVPALIGIFAFSQVLELIEQRKVVIAVYERTPRLIQTVVGKVFRTCKVNLLRSSLIGTFIGILPGAGGSVASLVAYAEAVRWDRQPEKYGHGAIEGVVASEAANNAVIGGALVPMMGLGIPGCSTAAVIMGALLIHGITPGSKLLVNSGPIAYTFIMSLLVSNFVMLIIGYFMLRTAANMLRVPVRLIIPMVLILAVIGSYTVSNNMVDVYVMIACGILSYILSKGGITPGPIALGLVLGPIAEDALCVALTIVQAKGSFAEVFVFRPLCLLIITMIVIALLSPVLPKLKRHRADVDS